MIAKDKILQSAKNTFLSESQSIAQLSNFLDDNYFEAINILLNCKGRIVITGIGKSAIIAQKIVATLNSTGAPALFLHAAEAIHGDLGMVQTQDAVICISKSGNSPEIKILLPFLQKFGNTIIAITGNMNSFLAQNANIVLNTTVAEESCPLNLAPTNSTTAQLVMGDALATTLMEAKGFTANDFAKYHPGGALGKKLLLRVKDMLTHSLKPTVTTTDTIKKVIFEISEKRLGVTAVLTQGQVIGIITDGDIRRMLNQYESFNHLTAQDIMTKNPKLIQADAMLVDALEILENHKITQLIVVEQNTYLGVLHLHDILKEGII